MDAMLYSEYLEVRRLARKFKSESKVVCFYLEGGFSHKVALA